MPYPLKYTGEQVDDLLDKINYLDVATPGEDGLMSSEDKTKLDNIEAGAQENVVEGISLGGAGITPVDKVINIQLDAQPTENSTNLINSGALYTKLLSYYTKTEVDAMLAVVWEPAVVSSLPTASADTMQKIYFVPSDNPETQNVKDEYITIRSGSEGSYTYSWEQIGSTAIDISGKADKDTDAVEGNLAKFDANGNPVDAGIAAEKVAKKGEIQTFAGNLVDTRSAGTRQGPFAFRQSGGDGVNYMRKILGRTEAFNQLIKGYSATTTTNGITISGDGTGKITITVSSATGYNQVQLDGFDAVQGHKYLATGWDYNTDKIQFYKSEFFASSANRGPWILQASQSGNCVMNLFVPQTTPITNKTIEIIVVDLTLMFGAGNEPATPEAFEALHPLPYYNYNAGVLKNNAATALETTGFNKWDEEWENGYLNNDGTTTPYAGIVMSKNFIPIFPNTAYYFNYVNSGGRICYYDANKQFISTLIYNTRNLTTPEGAYYMKFDCSSTYGTTYNHDICINISDASRNGDYEPYWKRKIVLGLDNLACHDENNNAVVVNGLDGVGTAQDELIVENGWGTKINKKMEEVDLGDLSWTYRGDLQTGKFSTNDVSDYAFQAPIMAICSKYKVISNQPGSYIVEDKTVYFFFQSGIGSRALYVTDTAYSDAAVFKAAMAGVKLRYEAETPKVLTLDNPIPALIEVDNLGTEKRLPEDTADNPQGPFECDSNYSISVANLVRKLNS